MVVTDGTTGAMVVMDGTTGVMADMDMDGAGIDGTTGAMVVMVATDTLGALLMVMATIITDMATEATDMPTTQAGAATITIETRFQELILLLLQEVDRT